MDFNNMKRPITEPKREEPTFDRNAVIIHYGVKGMKWGVRKDRTYSKTSGRDPALKRIDNKTLQSRISRLNMEKQYVRLVDEAEAKNASAISRGAKGVSKTLSKVGSEELARVTKDKLMPQAVSIVGGAAATVATGVIASIAMRELRGL